MSPILPELNGHTSGRSVSHVLPVPPGKFPAGSYGQVAWGGKQLQESILRQILQVGYGLPEVAPAFQTHGSGPALVIIPTPPAP